MELNPGYKQTEVGVIPEEWEVCQVRQKGEVVTGKALAATAPGAQRPYLRTKNVFDGRIDIDDVLTMPMTDEQFAQFRIRNGDVLLNEGQSIELVGRCAIYQDEYPEPCAIQNALLRFRARAGVSEKFASYLFRHCQQTGVFARIALQTTSVAHLGGSRFERLHLPWPTEEEQRAIATALSDVDGLLGGLDRLIAKKRDLKQAAMQQLLTGQTRLPGFSGVWDVKQLRECAQFLSGTYLAQDAYRDGPFEVQGAGSPMGRHIAANFREPVSVIGRVGTVGRPRFMPNGCWVNNNAGAVVALPGKATPEFIYLLLLTMDWSKSTSVTAQPFLVIESFLRTASKFPLIPEQIAISTVLFDMETELAALADRRDKTRAIKQGMMQELLTGRIRLVEAEALHA